MSLVLDRQRQGVDTSGHALFVAESVARKCIQVEWLLCLQTTKLKQYTSLLLL